jgi:hypothetical protein
MDLVVCGDSWTNGAELQRYEKCYGQLLSEQWGCQNYLNTSVDASSIPHLILQLQRFLKIKNAPNSTWTTPVNIVFFLTSTDRDLMWSTTHPIGTGFLRTDPPPYKTPREILLNASDPLHADWFTEYHSTELSRYRTNTTLLALQSMCQYHKLNDYYIWGWNTIPLWSEINVDKFYNQGRSHIANEFGDLNIYNLVQQGSPYIVSGGGHPSQFGHEKIAEILYNWICPI